MDIKLNNNSNLKFEPFLQLEYITSHTNEYINTGVNPSTTIKIEMEFSFNSVAGCPYGTQSTQYNIKSFQLMLYSGTTYYFITNTQGSDKVALVANKRYHIEHKYGIQKLYAVDDPETLLINNTQGSSGLSSTYPIYLFGKNTSTGIASRSSINMFWCKMYDGDTLIRDYVPSYDNYKYCLYDKVTKTYYHNLGGGAFTYNTSLGGSGLSQRIINLFIKDCPQIDALDVLRRITVAQKTVQNKLIRIRCNIGDVLGTLEELQHYTTLSGYSDNYEEQVKPRMVGTWTINTYHSNAEREAIDIDGLTILSDDNYNAEYLLDNDMLAVQTLDSTAPNYNPAAAIILQNAGYGRTLDGPIVEGETGSWFLPKAVASTITSISTIFRNAVDVIDANGIVSDDTTLEYPFESFEELQYTRITSIVAGSSTSALGSFGGCTKLERIILPETVTTIGKFGFYNCNKLESINIPRGLTANIGANAFYNCKSIINFDSPRGNNIEAFRGPTASVTTYQFGCGTGIFILHGTLTTSSQYATRMYFKKIIVTGFNWNVQNALTVLANTIVRISGTITDLSSTSSPGFTANVAFLEFTTLSLTSAANNRLFASGGTQEVFIRRADLLPSGTPDNFGSGTVSKFYVGLGQNEIDDNATLQLYLNDTNWGTVSAKLDTWYNYNGQYKWYYVTANLSNCTSTNPDSWYTHPTRGESYETTIVPDEGMTLDSVTVEMLDTDTTSSTYDTIVDITSSVYDSSTGEINIPSVTGNVVITASAS